MEHYSSTELRAYLKYENRLAVLDLKEKGLFWHYWIKTCENAVKNL